MQPATQQGLLLTTGLLDEHDPSMPGCAVLDLAMPRVNGLAVQQELVMRGIERPIIFVAERNCSQIVEAMKAGALDFLPKPFKDHDSECDQGRRGTR